MPFVTHPAGALILKSRRRIGCFKQLQNQSIENIASVNSSTYMQLISAAAVATRAQIARYVGERPDMSRSTILVLLALPSEKKI